MNNQIHPIIKINKGQQVRHESIMKKLPWANPSHEPDLKIEDPSNDLLKATRKASKEQRDRKRRKAAQAVKPSKPEPIVDDPVIDEKLVTKIKWTMKELLETDLPEPRWAIPDLLPIGLTFISGLPKAGKSWLGLQLAVSLSHGEEIFGIMVEKRKVLYLALEDGPRRLKNRLITKGVTTPGRVTFYLDWPLLEEGGTEKLKTTIIKRHYDFVIIDTLSRACGKDQLKANEMIEVLGPLQKLAIQNNLAVVVIDHNSKSRQGEPVLKLYGSIAKGGVADTIYDLTSDRTTGKGLLRGVGRDIGSMTDEVKIHLEWEPDGSYWKRVDPPLPSPDQLLTPGSFKDKVVKSIRKIVSRGELATCQSIAKDLGKKPPTVSIALTELCDMQIVIKLSKKGREQPYICPIDS